MGSCLNLYHAGALRHAQVGLLMITYFRDGFDHEVRPSLLPAAIYKVSDRET